MTPSTPPRTAAEQAELDAAARKAAEAVAQVKVVEESQAVQDTTKEAAALVAGAVTKLADKVSGKADTVADDLKAANAEDREERREESWRRFYTSLLLALPAIVAAIGSVFAAVRSNDSAHQSNNNGAQIEKVYHKVNSAMEYQLELVVSSAKKLAKAQPSEENIEALRIAEEALLKHKRGNEE